MDWLLLWQAVGGGIVMVVVVQATFERLSAQLALKDFRTLTALTILASIAACAAIHIHFLGPRPLPNLITVPVLLFLCLVCFLLLTYIPNETSPAPPAPISVFEHDGLSTYMRSSVGWAIRTALVAMHVAVLRSGSPI